MDNERQPLLAALASERYEKLVAGDPDERAVQAANRLLTLALFDHGDPQSNTKSLSELARKPIRTDWFGLTEVGDKKMATRIERVQNLEMPKYQIVAGVGGQDAEFGFYHDLPPKGQVYQTLGEIQFKLESLRSLSPGIFISGYVDNEGSRKWNSILDYAHPTAIELMSIVDDAIEARQ